MKDWRISDIEALTQEEVKELNPEHININEHDIYLVDFGGYFGFSALVFRNGSHLYYANDYELHHQGKTHEELKGWYFDTLHNKLFSDAMIYEPIKDYTDGENKDYYLRNYYPQMCKDKVSAFRICTNSEEEKTFEDEIKGMSYSPVGFFYTMDKAFIARLNELYQAAQESKKGSTDNYNYWFEAFKHEMFNHEYAISWQGDEDVISCFVNGSGLYSEDFETLGEMFDYAGFSNIQRQAYRAARSFVLKNSNY